LQVSGSGRHGFESDVAHEKDRRSGAGVHASSNKV